MINKYITFFLLLAFSSTLIAQDESDKWELYQAKFYFENDLFGDFTDGQYSAGEKLNLTYHVQDAQNPLYELLISNGSKADYFIASSLVNQIYTPSDISIDKLLVNDRPYAGYSYIETSIHKSTNKSLNSLILKVGMVGPASYSEQIQTGMHSALDIGLPQGWEHQLDNELGVNLSYIYKLRYEKEKMMGWLDTSAVPYVEAHAGNVSTQAALGSFFRVGYNIPKDFGSSTLDFGSEANIPAYDANLLSMKKDWSFSFNVSLVASAVLRDIFLDGNTFKESHSIEKNNSVLYYGTGFTLRYKRFTFDYMNTRNTNKFDKEGSLQDVGTVITTWTF